MQIKQMLLVFLLSFFATTYNAQVNESASTKSNDNDKGEKLNTGLVTIGLGGGILSFIGDIGKEETVGGGFSNFRGGFNLYAEKRFGKILGVSVNFLYGQLSQSERGARNANFETNVIQFGADVSGHLDWSQDATFSPYLKAGISYMLFDPYGDLMDENGNNYYYWEDGTIRDLPENSANENTSVVIKRDYEFETQLKDSVEYARGALAIPLTFGLKFRIAQSVEIRAEGVYNLVFSDHVDNISDGTGNDSYVYANLSFNYTIGRKYTPHHEKSYNDIDFGALFKEDGDHDGVPDSKDECHHTPVGILVDRKGCPLDDDNDGVPNHIDKEPNTSDTAVVNSMGVTLTDEDIALMRQYRDSVVHDRVEKFYEAASMETLQQIDEEVKQKHITDAAHTSAIPKQYRFADENVDGVLQSSEITAAIDMFFEGEVDMTVEQLYELIDFFFEQ